MSQYPNTKKIWDVNEQEAGSVAQSDPADLQVTEEIGEAGVEFGVFVCRDPGDQNKIKKFDGVFTNSAGVSLISNLASDYLNRKYGLGNAAAIARRGFFVVKIDVANKPVAGGAVILSAVAGKEGYLTSVGSPVGVVTGGVRIESVLDTVAIVYLEGKATLTVTNV